MSGGRWDEECDVACEDTWSPYSCGGDGYVLLYQIPEPGTEPEPEPWNQPTVHGMKLRGCYPLDENAGRSISKIDFPSWGRMNNEVGIG